jgi:hypothetical protein
VEIGNLRKSPLRRLLMLKTTLAGSAKPYEVMGRLGFEFSVWFKDSPCRKTKEIELEQNMGRSRSSAGRAATAMDGGLSR